MDAAKFIKHNIDIDIVGLTNQERLKIIEELNNQ